MFLGIGYCAYSKNQFISLENLNLSSDDCLIICNQTAPLRIILLAKRANAKIIRWSDLPLCELLDQRYKVSGVPRAILLTLERYITENAESFYTNQRSLDIHNLYHQKKARGIITRAIKDDFYIDKRYDDDVATPFHIIFLGVDFKRKKLEQAIKVLTKLKETHNVELIIIGPNKIDINIDQSSTYFYGNLNTSQIVTTLHKIKTRGFINIVFTNDEGAPIVTLELQALGTVCFCLQGGGAATYLANQENQFINQTDLLQKIKELFDWKTRLELEQKHARDFAKNFSKKQISEKLLKL